jgi:hypothetical protein
MPRLANERDIRKPMLVQQGVNCASIRNLTSISYKNGMIQIPGSVGDARLNVFALQIGEVGEDFIMGNALSEQVEDIPYPYSHSANAGTAAALVRLCRDAIHASMIPQFAPGTRTRLIAQENRGITASRRGRTTPACCSRRCWGRA